MKAHHQIENSAGKNQFSLFCFSLPSSNFSETWIVTFFSRNDILIIIETSSSFLFLWIFLRVQFRMNLFDGKYLHKISFFLDTFFLFLLLLILCSHRTLIEIEFLHTYITLVFFNLSHRSKKNIFAYIHIYHEITWWTGKMSMERKLIFSLSLTFLMYVCASLYIKEILYISFLLHFNVFLSTSFHPYKKNCIDIH